MEKEETTTMLIKWIVCQVPDEKREAFSKAQEAWKALTGADGFYGQWGGWNLHRPSEACIIAFWRNQNAYDQFMSSLHDTIFQANQQQHTYRSITVTVAEAAIEIPGSRDIACALTGKWLRAADCKVDPKREQHFLKVQQTVWNPALKQSAGMLGAVAAKVNQPACRYQIFSFWEEEEAHQQYIKSIPLLRQQAGTDRDTTNVIGYFVERNERWLVMV
jgi:heme-degrading monooxygenase HmoA